MDRQVPTILKGLSRRASITAEKYQGYLAKKYEKKRKGGAKWLGEDRKVKEFLNDLPAGKSILDIPCGTGRFFPFYIDRQFKFMGIDISLDMLDQANKRTVYDYQTELGSIFDIDTCNIFDVVVCTRFLNLIQGNDLKKAFSEMQRVGRRIIFTLRIKRNNPTGHYHRPHHISLIETFLYPGWKITRNEPVHERDYRMIEVSNEMG